VTGNIRVANLLDHETKSQVLLNIQATSGDPPSYGHTQVIFIFLVIESYQVSWLGFRRLFSFFCCLRHNLIICAMSFAQKIKKNQAEDYCYSGQQWCAIVLTC
jgi:hypothetical protein